jgi:hypothetical protein
LKLYLLAQEKREQVLKEEEGKEAITIITTWTN